MGVADSVLADHHQGRMAGNGLKQVYNLFRPSDGLKTAGYR